MNGNRFGSSWRRRVAGPAIALFLVLAIFASAPGVASAHGWGRVKQMDKFVQKIGDSIKKQSDLRFGDLAEALWAASSIAKMRGLGIINGYNGNVFKPNDPVKQSEALAMMVRAFDLEDEAKEMADRFGLSYEQIGEGNTVLLNGMLFPAVSKDARWALGYILLAVEEGWVKLSECDPQKPATRAWVSKVMVRALNHETQALAKKNTVLPFTDRAAIPADSIGYVAEAVTMGLFQGYENGTFQPNKPVTRAEMATILERFLGDELPSDVPYLTTGTVKSIVSKTIVIATSAGSQVTYTVSADALIVVDGQPSTLANVKAGDVVEVLSNGNGKALLITVKSHGTTPPTATEVTGEIVGITTPPALTLKITGQANRTITLATNCTIKKGATNLDYEDLALGDVVKVTLQNNKAISIKVVSSEQVGQTVTGVIYGITTSSAGVDVVVKNGSTQTTLRLAEDVQVTYGSTAATVSDLRVADEVQATVQNNLVTRIKIVARDTFGDMGGTITSITQTATETTVIVKSGGTSTTVKVTPQTVIKYGSTTLTRSDLRLGDVVRVELVSGVSPARAEEIHITTRGTSS